MNTRKPGDYTIGSGDYVLKFIEDGDRGEVWEVVGTVASRPLWSRQKIIYEWGVSCFGAEHMSNRKIRAARFLEEAAELAQAAGLGKDHAERVLDNVFSRPPGEIQQEVGGSANTLMALCETFGVSFDECQQKEIIRCLSTDLEKFRQRNLNKVQKVDTP